MAMPAENVVAFYKKRGRRGFPAARSAPSPSAPKLHAPTISAISRILATPEQVTDWSLTSLKGKVKWTPILGPVA